MATKSDQIRSLARSGVKVSEIAKRLGIAYQHAYKVCRDAGIATRRSSAARSPVPSKPRLSVDRLLNGGFVAAGRWEQGDTRLTCPIDLPKQGGVYAFSTGDEVMYVGLASSSLAQRLYFYGNPGASQRTNVRLNGVIREALASGDVVEIHYACPPSLDWNGFTVSGPEGLEAGLIQDFHLPWNVRGA